MQRKIERENVRHENPCEEDLSRAVIEAEKGLKLLREESKKKKKQKSHKKEAKQEVKTDKIMRFFECILKM